MLMKLVITLALFFIAFCDTTAQTAPTQPQSAADSTASKGAPPEPPLLRLDASPNRTDMIDINPLGFLFGIVNLSYYHAVSGSIAIGGGVEMPALKGVSGIGVDGEMRWYPSGHALRGFYVGPNVSYSSLTETIEDETLKASAPSVGAFAGWQWIPGNDFAIGLACGFNAYFISFSGNSIFSSIGQLNGVHAALRFDLGYAW